MEALTLKLGSILEITDEQFFKICQKNSDLRFELSMSGDMTIMPPAGSDTGMRNADLNADLVIWNRRQKLGFVFDSSAGFKLPNGANRSPDASWILKERWEALTSDQKSKFAPICPDFVMELMSPSDSLNVTQAKMQEYRDNGARLGWLINRKDREVEIYRIDRPIEILQSPTILSGDDVLPDFRLDLTTIW